MKKILCILMVLIIGLAFAAKSEETGTITTLSDYSTKTSVTINCEDYTQKYIHIENTGSSSMYYKVWGYAYGASEYYDEFISETVMLGEGSIDIKLANTAYAKIVILTKNNSGVATFKVSHTLTR